jgi:hypothetical protein
MTAKTKQIIVATIVIIIAFIGLKMFFTEPKIEEATLVADQTKNEFIDGQTILILLNRLNQVTLDDSIFTDKTFTSLVNFEKPITDQIIGRSNPFLPIGTDRN